MKSLETIKIGEVKDFHGVKKSSRKKASAVKHRGQVNSVLGWTALLSPLLAKVSY